MNAKRFGAVRRTHSIEHTTIMNWEENFMKRTFLTAAAAAFTLATATATLAGDFPSGKVDYVIPFGPGGESDVTARFQQPFFKKLFGEDLVVSYKPGGGGAVGWSQLNSMAGDGTKIMGINLPHIVIKPKTGDVGFKTDDITSVYMFHYTPDAIVVRDDSDMKSLQDVIDYAKANPKKLTFSGSGKGTANHLAQVKFDQMAGTTTTYVSFKGTGAAVTALLGARSRPNGGIPPLVPNRATKCACWPWRWKTVTPPSPMCQPSKNLALISYPGRTAALRFPALRQKTPARQCLTRLRPSTPMPSSKSR